MTQQPTRESRLRAAYIRRVYRFLNQVEGLTHEDYQRSRQFFALRDIDFAYVPKGWRFCKWVADRPQQIILWCGPGLVRDYLDAPSTLLDEMARLEAAALRQNIEVANGHTA